MEVANLRQGSWSRKIYYCSCFAVAKFH